jgi:predicted permease
MWKRLVSLFRRGRLDRELTEEIETHLAMQEDVFRREGMTPEAARAAARREFGGVARTMEAYRERRGIGWIETSLADLRYAFRGLRRNPGFAAAAILSLALGIGANTAIFSLYHALLLRLLPVERPQELVSLYRTGGWGHGFASYPLFLEIRKRTDLFQDVAARSGVERLRFAAGSGDRQETAGAEYVSGNYFRMLGVAPALGRLFTDDDNRTPHAHPLAVLSYDFWQTRFGGDPATLGRTVIVGNQPLTVIGVAARGFTGVEVDHRADLWQPAMMYADNVMEPGMNWVWIVGRRRSEVSARRIQSAIDVFYHQYLESVYGSIGNAAFRSTVLAQQIEVRDGAAGFSILRDQFGKPLMVLMAAVLLVLLASCANVANLLLARAAARRKEIAMRISLGATRGRLVRQALTESLLLVAAGALAGMAFAVWGTHAILGFLPTGASDPSLADPDSAVLAFTIAISVASALLFGLVPGLRSTGDILPRSRDRKGAGTRRAVVIAQVAFSVVLVVFAALFGDTLARARAIDLGFSNQSVTTLDLQFPDQWKAAEMGAARARVVAQIETLPGISLVSYGAPGPYQDGTSSGSVGIPGSPTVREPVWVDRHNIGPRYFEILGSPPLAGREFDRADLTASPRAAVVNEEFARRYLPGEKHVPGSLLNFGEGNVPIVGLVRNIRHQGLREKVEPTVYLPLSLESGGMAPSILVRSGLPPAALAQALRRDLARFNPQIAISDPKTIRSRIDESIYRERLLAALGGFFGLLALALAAIGLYGVVAYGTARRAAEIGIRVALGARRTSVVWIVLQDALLLVGIGLLIGLPLALAAGSRVSVLLTMVPEAGVTTLTATAAVLIAIALIAALVPARRAATLDPMRVLRSE